MLPGCIADDSGALVERAPAAIARALVDAGVRQPTGACGVDFFTRAFTPAG